MVVEERTKSKPTSQHTKEEIRGLENFLILRLGITSTEVSSILRHYGVATIAMMRQAVYEEDLATALQLQSKAQKEEEELTINEHKQLKQSEETLTTNEVITMMLQATHEETLAPAEENLNTKPEEKSTTTAQKQPEEIRKEKIASALRNTKEPQPKVHQQEPSTRGGPQKKTQKEESLITKKFFSKATVARDKS